MEMTDSHAIGMTAQPPKINYVVDPEAVADAIIRRINKLADERARHRRSLMASVEVLVPGDYNGPALQV